METNRRLSCTTANPIKEYCSGREYALPSKCKDRNCKASETGQDFNCLTTRKGLACDVLSPVWGKRPGKEEAGYDRDEPDTHHHGYLRRVLDARMRSGLHIMRFRVYC
jgi:hypothetical protein